MSTRGFLGFKYRDEYKIAYNHYDSYPSHLGVNIKNELKLYTIEQMEEKFDKIMPVNDNLCPSREIIEKLYDKGYVIRDFYEKEEKNVTWYTLLRDWQGTIKPYIEYDYPYMCDGKQYGGDWIEYSYIIDLDYESFVVYYEDYRYYLNISDDDSYAQRHPPVVFKLSILNDLSDDEFLDILNSAWSERL